METNIIEEVSINPLLQAEEKQVANWLLGDEPRPKPEPLFNDAIDRFDAASISERVLWLKEMGYCNRFISNRLKINLRTVRRMLQKCAGI